jgi:Tfp pilus assembly protein PilF
MSSDATTRSDDALERTVKEVTGALDASDNDRAFTLADEALRQGMQHPALFDARGIGFGKRGRYREALADFECARAEAPRDPAILNSIGMCLLNLERFRQAVAAFDQAIASDPNYAGAYCNRAAALEKLGDADAAQKSLERALDVQPDNLGALLAIASIALSKGQRADARLYAQRALAIEANQPSASFILAKADMEDKNFAAAEQTLRAELEGSKFSGDDLLSAQGLLADALDRQDRTADAFQIYSELNEKLYRIHAPTYAVGRAIDNVRGLTAYFERSDPWKASPPSETGLPDRPVGHVFLLGFMRSGTTLVESILASAPQIVALDEHDALRDAAINFLNNDTGVARLSALEGAELPRWREVYWRSVRSQGISLKDKIFVDKLPFHSIKLPLIARLFPEAKVLFALRDPRDVVLSAFRNQFAVQTDTFEFLRLEDCARYYAAVMELCELYWSKLPLNLRALRYEDLVKDFDATVKAVCSFVGIEWKESMREFSEGVRAIHIRSVSAPQVRQGLYSGAAGQWRRYERELAPVLPILEPWVQRFGYPAR